MERGERSFTVEATTVGTVGGRYINKTPREAAKKAARHLFDETNKQTLRLQLRETTQGSPHRLFAYEAKRVPIDKTVRIAGKERHFSQEVKLRKVKEFHGDGVRVKS